jgi:hypothetical protein
MSDGEFHAFVGLLAAAGLVLAVLAVAGFDQRAGSRFTDGVVAAAYLGGAAYLQVTGRSLPIYFFAAGAPVLALLLHLLRERARARRKRLAAGLTKMYVKPPANTPLTPYPAPPPPLDPASRTKDKPPEPVAPRAYRPMPSGLPPRGEAAPPPPAGHDPTSPPPAAHAEPAGHDTAPPPPAGHDATPPPQPAHAERAGHDTAPPRPAAHAEPAGHDTTPPPQPAHAEPAGHDTAGVEETSSRLRRPAYLEAPDPRRSSGRHRAAGSDD